MPFGRTWRPFRLAAEDVRQEAPALSRYRAVGLDNMRPRQFALWCGQALSALGQLFGACERLGSLAFSVFANVIVFLVKPSGAVRSIGIIPAFYTSKPGAGWSKTGLFEHRVSRRAQTDVGAEAAVALSVSTAAIMVDLW